MGDVRSPQTHRSDPRVLGRRTLERDHRFLARLLRPGMTVLDVGCGTGAITAGIAKAVEPGGHAVGVDRDLTLLETARRDHSHVPNLRFIQGEATSLTFDERFDIITAARTLQWISDPALAILSMVNVAKPGGLIVVLDYNHEKNLWNPDPPAAFRIFYRAFLDWRASHRWDNLLAEHLPDLFATAGLKEVSTHIQDELTERGDPLFEPQAALWSQVIETLGDQLIQAGLLNQSQLRSAAQEYTEWVQAELFRQTLAMQTVVGTV